MLGFRPLPWDYGVRNLLRRPGRSALTLGALTLVVLLIFVVVGFLRGLEACLAVSGDPQVVIIHALGAAENVENSLVEEEAYGKVFPLSAIHQRFGEKYLSKERYMGIRMRVEGHAEENGLVRGVRPEVLLVRRQVQIVEGKWPGLGECLVGRLAAAKLGQSNLRPGETIFFEKQPWKVSGVFAARGSILESEVWVRLEDLQQALKLQTLSILALTLAPGAEFADVDEFLKSRLDLELSATRETDYYASLQKHFQPIRALGWVIVVLVGASGVFAGLNTMYGAVVGRVRELATLQTIGFLRRAIALSLVQESTLLAAAGSLAASLLALSVINGLAVPFPMGAVALRIDSVALMVGCGTGLLLGLVGALPPALRAMRLPVAEGLKAV